MSTIRLRITGRVQGVGFRWFTRETATRLGLRGTVRNAQDGSVEVTASGPAEALTCLRERLREGPSGARVDGIEDLPATSAATRTSGFRILR